MKKLLYSYMIVGAIVCISYLYLSTFTKYQNMADILWPFVLIFVVANTIINRHFKHRKNHKDDSL